MKIRHFTTGLLIILYICASPFHNLFAFVKGSDPITDSYIINNLQMESRIAPPVSDQESAEGEIIFDNTFDDSFSAKTKPESAASDKTKLKKLFASDKRIHLTEYRIKHKDNLSSIAKRSGTTVRLLMEINNIKNPALLKENDIILVPSKKGVYYTIRKGDTLTGIARRFDIEIDTIAEHNNIDSRRIIAGRKIFLPGAVEPFKKHLPPAVNKHRADYDNIDKIAVNEKKKEKGAAANSKVILSWPLRGPITSAFGMRTHPLIGEERFHCGMDIGAEVGTVVRAAGDGTVIFSGWKDTYGNMIVISHKNNYITVYAHNSKLFVNVNEKIKKGQKISLSGKTGAVTGAHLHFEIRKGIIPLNPLRILK